jgi:hypothetical protein
LLYTNNIAKENLLEIAHNPQAINHDLLSKKEKLQMPSINNSCWRYYHLHTPKEMSLIHPLIFLQFEFVGIFCYWEGMKSLYKHPFISTRQVIHVLGSHRKIFYQKNP